MQNQLYLAGEFVAATSGQTKEVYDPGNGEKIGDCAWGNADDARLALTAATTAREPWANQTARERALFLRDIASRLRAAKHELANLLTRESGKPRSESLGEVEGAALHFEWYAEEGQRLGGDWLTPMAGNKRHIVMRQPVGVVYAVIPWNFPLVLWARKVAPALAAGCPVVCKPAEPTTLITMAALQICHDAGLPRGVINLVTGEPASISDALLGDARCAKLTFTGSTPVGVVLRQQCAAGMVRASMELGGNAAGIVFADADIPLAAKKLLGAKFRNNGQSCIAVNRILVEEKCLANFLVAFKTEIATLQVGYGMEEGVTQGAIINERTLQKIENHVADALAKGGELLLGGERVQDGSCGQGRFFAPTLIVCNDPTALYRNEETFGPVAFVSTFKTEAEAVAVANETPFGLAAYIMTDNLSRAIRVAEKMEAGTVAVNDDVPSTTIAPFGGFKMSGIGRECGSAGIEAFLETKHVTLGL